MDNDDQKEIANGLKFKKTSKIYKFQPDKLIAGLIGLIRVYCIVYQ